MSTNRQRFFVAATFGALLGNSGCERNESSGSLRAAEDPRERSSQLGRPPGETTVPMPPEIRDQDISGQSYGERDDELNADDLGAARNPRTRGTYSVITTEDRTGGAGAAAPAGAYGGVNARESATGGGAKAGNTGATGGANTGATGGANTGATGGANTGATGGANTAGTNTGGTGGGLNAGTNTGGAPFRIRGDAGTRLDNPDSFGTGTKYPDDSL